VPGQTLRGTSFATFAGGKGANQAVAAARAGASVTFAGAIGDDAFGHARIADLRDEGINVSYVLIREGVASGVASILVDDRGENVIVLVPGANDIVDPEHALHAIGAVYPQVISLTQEVPFETVAAAIRGKPAGTIVVHNAAPFDERVATLLDGVDVLVCNESEAAALVGREVSRATAEDDARALRALGCGSAIITLGADGAFVADDSESWHVSSPRVDVVDTTGAGDALCGVVAAWLSHGATLREAVEAGVCAGALAVMRAGAQPSLPTREAIESVLREQLNS